MTPDIRKSVAFIFHPDATGNLIPFGTAFFVARPWPKKPDTGMVFLVTARHVILKPDGGYLDPIFVRINKTDGGAEFTKIDLSGPVKAPVFTHSDPSVDIAVIPVVPDLSKHDVKFLLQEMLVSKQQFSDLSITEGDDIFFAGLFTPYVGAKRNYPILRFGKVALITDEKIPFGKDCAELYLMETQSFGGNSGSPVFFLLSPSRGSRGSNVVIGPPRLFLAGVMKGTFLNASEITIAERAAVLISRENVGIAAVVPGYLLSEILESKPIRDFGAKEEVRIEALASEADKSGPPPAAK